MNGEVAGSVGKDEVIAVAAAENAGVDGNCGCCGAPKVVDIG